MTAFQSGFERDASFRVIYDSYSRPLQRFFARKGLSPEDCLDLTQETFLGIYRGLETYRPAGRFESWLYHLAKTAFLKRLRTAATAKRSGQEVSLEGAKVSPAVSNSSGSQLEDLLDGERQQAIRKAVRRLPEQMRKCLTLRLYHDLTYREIAAIMKLEINTVKAHLFQARKKLEEKFDGLGLEELDD